jgi:hypothetical protein
MRIEAKTSETTNERRSWSTLTEATEAEVKFGQTVERPATVPEVTMGLEGAELKRSRYVCHGRTNCSYTIDQQTIVRPNDTRGEHRESVEERHVLDVCCQTDRNDKHGNSCRIVSVDQCEHVELMLDLFI